MRLLIHKNYELMSKWTAKHIAKSINEFKPTPQKPFVLGLPTGSSPVGTYKQLAAMCKRGKVSFKNVVTFNMDEYVKIPEDHPESYHFFVPIDVVILEHGKASPYSYSFLHIQMQQPDNVIYWLDEYVPDY